MRGIFWSLTFLALFVGAFASLLSERAPAATQHAVDDVHLPGIDSPLARACRADEQVTIASSIPDLGFAASFGQATGY